MKTYFQTVSQLAVAPRRFFSTPEAPQRRLPPLVFLCVSSLISALSAALLGSESGTLLKGAIWTINGIGMAFLAALFAYAAILTVADSPVSFSRLFAVFAHSSGITLLISWNPVLLVFTEPWKWWLVWTGMRRGCGLGRWQAAVGLILSVGMIIMLFQILLPLTAPASPGAL